MTKKKRRDISMRKVREILRLSVNHKMSNREIAQSCSVSHGTVAKYVLLVKEAGLTPEMIQQADDVTLGRLLGKDKAPQ